MNNKKIIIREGQKYSIESPDGSNKMIFIAMTIERVEDKVWVKLIYPTSYHTAFRLSTIEEVNQKNIITELSDFEELSKVYFKNSPQSIKNKFGKLLYQNPNHPICIVKNQIYSFFDGYNKMEFQNPMVSIKNNFDDLLIPADHPGRRQTDTFYSENNWVLRTHTTAHQSELLKAGVKKFICTGDVYRRDTIDASHFPVFHQVEGVNILGEVSDDVVIEHLKDTLSGLIKHLFGNDVKYRFVDEYFPFTHPSFEVEVEYHGKEMEVLGSGVIHKDILKNCGLEGQNGWAFGMGLERLAMIFFDIPDIRYFWTEDERFLNQFKSGQINKFQPYSKYPPVTRDVSMWIPEGFDDNYFYDIVRDAGGNLVEEVSLGETFTHPKTLKVSKLYHISFRSLERTMTSEEIEDMLIEIKKQSVLKGCEVR